MTLIFWFLFCALAGIGAGTLKEVGVPGWVSLPGVCLLAYYLSDALQPHLH